MAITNTLYEHRMSLLWDELYKAHARTKRNNDRRDEKLAIRDTLITAYLIMSGQDHYAGNDEDAIYERLEKIWLNDI